MEGKGPKKKDLQKLVGKESPGRQGWRTNSVNRDGKRETTKIMTASRKGVLLIPPKYAKDQISSQ